MIRTFFPFIVFFRFIQKVRVNPPGSQVNVNAISLGFSQKHIGRQKNCVVLQMPKRPISTVKLITETRIFTPSPNRSKPTSKRWMHQHSFYWILIANSSSTSNSQDNSVGSLRVQNYDGLVVSALTTGPCAGYNANNQFVRLPRHRSTATATMIMCPTIISSTKFGHPSTVLRFRR